ncbi:S8 family peptidase, partial [Candidatus Venteria ishoeyi]|uniref:S8 family peptidase n=1 Tax=Candidatus Venteria ishoeyi TaxID=1899563 RepID=UPI000CDEF313
MKIKYLDSIKIVSSFLLIFIVNSTLLLNHNLAYAAIPASKLYKITELKDKASQNSSGVVRVIVQLNMGYKIEGELEEEEDIEIQRTQIQELQNNIIQSLAGENAQAYTKFRYIPHMALMVDEQALDAITLLDEVINIFESKFSDTSLSNSATIIGRNQGSEYWTDDYYTGKGQAVAVIDTGIDIEHPYLADRIISEACYSIHNPTSGLFSVCPNSVESSTVSGSGDDCVYHENVAGYPDAESFCQHGTHVAGIVAGQSNDTSNDGVSTGADIIAIQAGFLELNPNKCPYDKLSCIKFDYSTLIESLERIYELQNKELLNSTISAVNMSMGFNVDNCEEEAEPFIEIINNLKNLGVAVIASSGNNGFRDGLKAPACLPNVISVGATSNLNWFSDIVYEEK